MADLIRYEAARSALAECKSIDEVKGWTDKAAALQAYGRMAKDKTLEVDAAEIRIRSERRLGEMLATQKAGEGLAKPGVKPKTNSVVSDDRIPTLADSGISKDLSSRAQTLAAVPIAEFEKEVAEWREKVNAEGEKVSAKLQKAGKRHQETSGNGENVEPEPEMADDTLAMLEEAHRDIERLTAELKAAEADDLKAEALKWRRSYDAAVRGQSEAMDRAKQATDREAWAMRQLRRCGKAIGQDDPTKIAAVVEGYMRKLAA